MIAEEFSGDQAGAFYLGFLLRLVLWYLLCGELDLAEGMPRARAGTAAARSRAPFARLFSLYVVQAGSAVPARCGRLPRQRSTGLVKETGGQGRAAQVSHGAVPDAWTGSLSPPRGGRSGAPRRVREGRRRSGRLRRPRGSCWQPEATAGSQLVSWTTME